MTLLRLAAASLRARALVAALTTGSIALTVALVMGVAAMRAGVEAGFTSTLAGTDLIVGARGGALQLLLFTVFGIGSVPDNVSWEAYERWAGHKAVAWAVPVSLGDSHRGFRVVGTTGTFFDDFRLRGDSRPTVARGERPGRPDEVALGSEVAKELGYRIGQPLVLTHGMGVAGISDHVEHPFVVRGVLAATRTPFDRSLVVTLQGLAAIHGGRPEGDPGEVTAFFVGTHTPFDVLHLQRAVQEDRLEPLSAILPGVTIGQLWRALRVVDIALWAIFSLVAVVSLAGLAVALLTSLQERRREMAVLRALGCGRAGWSPSWCSRRGSSPRPALPSAWPSPVSPVGLREPGSKRRWASRCRCRRHWSKAPLSRHCCWLAGWSAWCPHTRPTGRP